MDPMKILTMCGATRPTKPMVPVKQTMAQVHSATIRNTINLNLSGRNPTILEKESPADSVLIIFEDDMSTMVASDVTGTTTNKLPHVAFPKVPTFQA